MASEVQAILRYWRNSLADGQRRSPPLSDRSILFTLSLENLKEGSIRRLEATAILEAEAQRILRQTQGGASEGKGVPDQAEEARILLCPWPLDPIVEHREAVRPRNRVCPVWIAAVVDREGRLRREERVLPWFDRAYLEPVQGAPVTFGTAAAQDEFLTRLADQEDTDFQDDSWAALWNLTERLIEAVHGGPVEDAIPPGYALGKPLGLL